MPAESGLAQKVLTSSGISAEDLLHAYRSMYLSRRLDDREVILKRRNQIFFQISAAGHEAIQTAAGMVLRPGFDWCYPYYRDRSLALALGVKPRQMFLQALGAGADEASGGAPNALPLVECRAAHRLRIEHDGPTSVAGSRLRSCRPLRVRSPARAPGRH